MPGEERARAGSGRIDDRRKGAEAVSRVVVVMASC
jgi:hypothetical protein